MGRGHVVGIGNDERPVLTSQEVENIIVEPAGMAKLERGACCLRQLREKGFQARQILLHVWRKLEKYDAQLICEHCSSFVKILRLVIRLFQSLEMRDALRSLERKTKRAGHLLLPVFEHARLRHAVEGGIDFHRTEALGVE